MFGVVWLCATVRAQSRRQEYEPKELFDSFTVDESSPAKGGRVWYFPVAQRATRNLTAPGDLQSGKE